MATRTTLKNRINRILGDNTNGLFCDDGWVPVNQAFRALDVAGYVVNLTGTRYEHDENGTPCRKIWTFEIEMGSKKPFYGLMTAHGAGTVADPLAQYDVTAYVS